MARSDQPTCSRIQHLDDRVVAVRMPLSRDGVEDSFGIGQQAVGLLDVLPGEPAIGLKPGQEVDWGAQRREAEASHALQEPAA